MRKIKCEEIKDYQNLIGKDQFRKEYLYIANKSRRLEKNDIRYSGKKYKNTPQKLLEIKNKYKNGITDEIINQFMCVN